MSVKLRFKRLGRKNRPFYRLVAIDSRKRRDGREIEKLGWFNPSSVDETFKFNEGSTYSEFKTGDKIAAVGIGALLATTLGVKALSQGLLATLGKLLAKFWFILLLPFIFIGKLIDSLKTKRKRR